MPGTRLLFIILFRDPIAFSFSFQDLIAFYFMFMDLIAFLFYVQGPLCKKIDSQLIPPTTISLSSLFEHNQPTKHVRKSKGSLYEINMSEVRRSFSSDTGYQTHPKFH
jgi:hypothetical protein